MCGLLCEGAKYLYTDIRLSKSIKIFMSIQRATQALQLHVCPRTAGSVLFLNAEYFPECGDLTAIQPDYCAAQAFATQPEAPTGQYSEIWVLGSKQADETRGLIGLALAHSVSDSKIVIALENALGGKSIARDLDALGLAYEAEGKCHARVYTIFMRGQSPDMALAKTWRAALALQPVLEGAYWSCSGLYGWNKIDAGSALLMRTLPPGTLCGAVADFGCGYGYLTLEALRMHPDMTSVMYADCDRRALAATAKNIAALMPGFTGKTEAKWCDVPATSWQPAYDFVLMNPPFHALQAQQASLGQGFIRAAAQALRPGGTLWLVANRHLPYEDVLRACFAQVTRRADADGFKVYEAQK